MALEVAKQNSAKIVAAASGRRTLGVEDDSSSESGESPQKRARGKCQPHMQPTTVDNLQLVEIEYGGIRFKACRAKQQIYVEARADVAKAIVDACLDRTASQILDATSEMMTSKPKEGCQPKPDAAAEGCQPTGTKRIGFIVSKASYEVRYVAEDGTKRRTIGGLKVRTSNNKGMSLSPDEHDENMRRVHRAARAKWNELDKSGEPRFTLE